MRGKPTPGSPLKLAKMAQFPQECPSSARSQDPEIFHSPTKEGKYVLSSEFFWRVGWFNTDLSSSLAVNL